MSPILPSKANWHMSTPACLPAKVRMPLYSRTSSAMSSCLWRTASLRHVFWKLSCALTSAEDLSRKATTSFCPSDAATCSGDRLKASKMLTLSCPLSRALSSGRSPRAAAVRILCTRSSWRRRRMSSMRCDMMLAASARSMPDSALDSTALMTELPPPLSLGRELRDRTLEERREEERREEEYLDEDMRELLAMDSPVWLPAVSRPPVERPGSKPRSAASAMSSSSSGNIFRIWTKRSRGSRRQVAPVRLSQRAETRWRMPKAKASSPTAAPWLSVFSTFSPPSGVSDTSSTEPDTMKNMQSDVSPSRKRYSSGPNWTSRSWMATSSRNFSSQPWNSGTLSRYSLDTHEAISTCRLCEMRLKSTDISSELDDLEAKKCWRISWRRSLSMRSSCSRLSTDCSRDRKSTVSSSAFMTSVDTSTVTYLKKVRLTIMTQMQ
mmetsp:Transcript_4317/g.12621  ORF Transcript_4317/g.12621 Transcript_4317/m.12621 type:complete len:437 (+) Transcript_4317:1214-2524(+)